MDEKRVKGTLLLDYVCMIRANKDKDWQKYLKPEDWEIINGRILPSLWYPYETFERAGMATFYVLGGGNFDAVRAWGKISYRIPCQRRIQIHHRRPRSHDSFGKIRNNAPTVFQFCNYGVGKSRP